MIVSLIELCYRTAQRLDDVGRYFVSTASAFTVGIAGLINQTTGASAARYGGRWCYSGDQQMRVKTDGYAPATGELALQHAWSRIPAPNDAVYLTGLFPIQPGGSAGEDTSYQDFVRAALGSLAYPERLEVPITTNDRYPLEAAWPWLDRDARGFGLQEPAPVAGRSPIDATWRRPRIERTGIERALVLDAPFGVGVSGVLTISALRPASTLVDGAESTTGPQLDAHAVDADPDDVVSGALAYAYHALAARAASSPDGAAWAAKYEAQVADFEGRVAFDRTRRLPPTPAPAGGG